MARETKDSFKWVLYNLRRDLGCPSKVLLTDGDLWMAFAIEHDCGLQSSLSTELQSVHLLCIWHLSKVVLRHISPCFGAGSRQAFNIFMNSWWSLCQKSDSAGRDRFDADWQTLKTRLRDLLSPEQRQNPSFSHALGFLGGPTAEWELELSADNLAPAPDLMDLPEDEHERFASLYDLRMKWASRWTYKYFTHGAASTQRGEQCFASVKENILAGGALSLLISSLVGMVESSTRKMLHRLPRHLLRTHASDTAKQPLIAHLSEMGASPFLLDLAMAILGRVSLYQSEVLPNQESTPLASRKFRVWFHAHATSPGTTEGLGGQDQRDLEDMGLCEICGVEESLSHITTFTSCSCQRERKWGVFCVHMGLVYVNNNVARIPEGVVHKAWLPQADKERSCTDEVMQRLLDDMEGISIEHATQAGSSSVPPPAVRYQQMVLIGKAVAHQCRMSTPAYKFFHKLLLEHISVEEVEVMGDAASDQASAEGPSSSNAPLSANPQSHVCRRRRFRACWEGGRGRGGGAKRKRSSDESAGDTVDGGGPAQRVRTGPSTNGGAAKGRGRGRGRGRGQSSTFYVDPSLFAVPSPSSSDEESRSLLLQSLDECDAVTGMWRFEECEEAIPEIVFRKSSDAVSNQSESLIDRFIFYKTLPRRLGGWRLIHVCKLVATSTTRDSVQYCTTFIVEYCTDGEQSKLLLDPFAQTKEGVAELGAWWPLRQLEHEATEKEASPPDADDAAAVADPSPTPTTLDTDNAAATAAAAIAAVVVEHASAGPPPVADLAAAPTTAEPPAKKAKPSKNPPPAPGWPTFDVSGFPLSIIPKQYFIAPPPSNLVEAIKVGTKFVYNWGGEESWCVGEVVSCNASTDAFDCTVKYDDGEAEHGSLDLLKYAKSGRSVTHSWLLLYMHV